VILIKKRYLYDGWDMAGWWLNLDQQPLEWRGRHWMALATFNILTGQGGTMQSFWENMVAKGWNSLTECPTGTISVSQR